jgi:hypothetical protein
LWRDCDYRNLLMPFSALSGSIILLSAPKSESLAFNLMGERHLVANRGQSSCQAADSPARQGIVCSSIKATSREHSK